MTGLAQAIADAYYAQWKSQALGSDNHLLVQYGHESSWSLGENMFADMWLQTGLIGRDVRIRSLIRLAKEGRSDFAADIRGAGQLSEDREYHWGVSHIYRCGNWHTIGQPAHQQRDLQFESILLLIPSYAGTPANCL